MANIILGKLLRFSPDPGPTGWKKAALSLLTVALLIILLALCVYVFYSLSILWFKNEFTRATFEQARVRTQATADHIARTMPAAFLGIPLTPLQKNTLQVTLAELVQQNLNLVAVMVIDAHGRVVMGSNVRAIHSNILPNPLNPNGPSLRAVDEQTLAQALREEHPDLIHLRVEVTRAGRPAGALRVLFDPDSVQGALAATARRMTARLTLLLVALTAVIASAVLIIRRQRVQARRLIAQRNDAEQLAYVGTLAAGLAHELRNPLNALAMQLELLEEDVQEGSSQMVAPRLARIRKGLVGVERTVHDFLTYATPGRQKPQLVDLESAISAICAAITESGDHRQVQLDCLVPQGLQAWCDPHALRQILDNLLNNGLRAQQGRRNPALLRVEAARAGHWVDIVVDDAGPGINPELGERIFECFYTTLPEGTGLGLPIARRLARMNGGHLTFDPEPSPLGGARFRLRLSAHPLPESPLAAPASKK